MEEAFTRVAKGAMFLDRRLSGWRENVDPLEMNLSCGDHCLLGQVGYRDRRLGLRNQPEFVLVNMSYFEMTRIALGLTEDDAVELGFAVEDFDTLETWPYALAYGNLHTAWIRTLR